MNPPDRGRSAGDVDYGVIGAGHATRDQRPPGAAPVVVLSFDGDALDRFWLADYVPELIAAERRRYPAISLICEALGGHCEIQDVAIPVDCVDGFTEAFYARPESFLDPGVRASQSAWAFVDAVSTQRAVDRLRADLATGEWDRRNGELRRLPVFLGSLRLIVATPRNGAGAPAPVGATHVSSAVAD